MSRNFEFTVVLLSQVSVGLASVVGIKLLTGILPPSSYGELALTLTLAITLQNILSAPLCAAIRRYYPIVHSSGELGVLRKVTRDLANTLFKFVCLLSLIAATTAMICRFPRLAATLILLGGLTTASLVTEWFQAYQIAAQHRLSVALLSSITNWAKYLSAYFFTQFGPKELDSLFALLGMTVALIAVIPIHLLLDRPTTTRGTPSTTAYTILRRQIFHYAQPLSLAGICRTVQALSARWILYFVSGPTPVGLYAACFQIGNYPLQLSYRAITEYITPKLFAQVGNQPGKLAQKRAYQKLNYLALIIMIGGLTIVFFSLLFHEPILLLLTGTRYKIVSYLLPVIVATTTLTLAGESLSLYFMIDKVPHKLLNYRIIGVASTLAFGVLGCFFHGLDGLVYAFLLQSMIMLGLMISLINVKIITED